MTRAATDQTALAGDQLQYEEGEGPCLDAVTREQWVITPDAQIDQRWPRFSTRLAKELNVHSMLSVRLATSALPGRNLGGLNLYSTRPGSIHRRAARSRSSSRGRRVGGCRCRLEQGRDGGRGAEPASDR